MKNYAITLLVLLVVTGIHLNIQRAHVLAAQREPLQFAFDIPSRIGTFTQTGPDYEVDENVRELLQTSQILMRTYESTEGWPVYLTIVYAGTTRRSLHFPEVCLVGQGWEIREQYSEPVGFSFAGKHLVLIKSGRQEAVLYWFKTGNKLTGNYFVNSWHWARNQLRLGTSTSAMIRLSAPIRNNDEEKVFALLEDFAIQFAPILMSRVK